MIRKRPGGVALSAMLVPFSAGVSMMVADGLSSTARAEGGTAATVPTVVIAPPSPTQAAPMLSAPSSSLPQAPAAAVSARAPMLALTAAVHALTEWAATAKARVGVDVIDVATGAVLAAENEHRVANPASNTKVLTAAVALDRMGGDYHFTTGLYGRVTVDGAGAPSKVSPLVLRGNGDPSLETDELWQLASALVQLGVKHVDGVLVDQSYFDDSFVPPAFEQQPNEWAPFRAPVSAVALERNAVTLNVAPRHAGSPAAVWFDPPGFVEVSGTIATRHPAGDGVNLTLSPSGARLAATVAGFVGDDIARRRYAKRVEDPRLFAGYVFSELLREMGIDVRGTVSLGGAGEHERIAYVESQPLAVLVRELGKNSDNFYAETLLKALGGYAGGAPAHSASGADAVVAWLQQNGAYDPGTIVKNGSGLFDANRVSPFTLASTLRTAYLSPRIGPDFVTQLAVGGVDGTLRNRFRALSAKRAVRAKTGTLDDVIALSGYVLAPGAEPPVAFSFIAEGVTAHHAEARDRIDKCIEAIATSLWRK